jgi:hypothetical protein
MSQRVDTIIFIKITLHVILFEPFLLLGMLAVTILFNVIECDVNYISYLWSANKGVGDK